MWVVGLDDPPADAPLSPQERGRAARFVRDEDARRWTAARATLRRLLGAYLDTLPHELHFAEGPFGKPRIAREEHVRFNVSHSAGVGLIAVARDREVGVDVELPRRAVDHVALARRVLGEAEAQWLAALDPPDREREFLRAWVRWEAVLKFRGIGIGGAEHAHAGPDPWVAELPIDPPAAAALAVEGGPVRVRTLRWPPGG